MERRIIVSVIGNAASTNPQYPSVYKTKWELSFELGKALVDNGYRVLSGGGRGVMRAVFAGAHASKKYREGDTIALVPSYGQDTANDFADIVIPTGLDLAQDIIVANSKVVIAVGGGAGTLNELSAAWKLGHLIIAYENADGWSKRIANHPVDECVRYPGMEDKVWGVTNAKEVIKIIKEKLPVYNCVFDSISFGIPQLKKDVPASEWIGPIQIANDPFKIQPIENTTSRAKPVGKK